MNAEEAEANDPELKVVKSKNVAQNVLVETLDNRKR